MNTKKPLSILLTLALVLGLLPWTVMPARAVKYGVSYIDANGRAQTEDNVEVVVESMGTDNAFISDSGWLYVEDDVSLNNGASNNGGVAMNLILGDDKTLTLSASLRFINASLTIYGQSGGTGKLTISGSTANNPMLALGSNTLTINGGTVEATNNAQNYGVYAFGNTSLVMNGGSASFTASMGTAVYGNVTLNGGKFYANGRKGAVTGTVRIKDGLIYKDDSNPVNYYVGTLTTEQKTAINGKTLTPAPNAHNVTVTDGVTNGTVTVDKAAAESGDTVTLTATPDSGFALGTVTVTGTSGTVSTSGTGNTRTFTMPDEDVTVSATFTQPVAQVGEVKYYDVQEAINAANGGTVTLLADVTLDAALTVPAGRAGTLALKGHTIDRGLADSGAVPDGYVIRIEEGSTLTLTDNGTGGKLTGGNDSSGCGGVWVYEYGEFNMTGGEISGNIAAQFGGGVMNGGTFTMTDGKISDNIAYIGGGLYNNGTFTMTGGEISDNTASVGGGGVVMRGTSSISGKPVIKGNKVGGAENNVDLRINQSNTVTVTGALTDGASIYVNVDANKTVAQKGDPRTAALSEDELAYFHSDDAALIPMLDGGVVKLASAWGVLQAALDAGGTVTLDHDYTAGENDGALVIPENTDVTLDLNGHVIDRGLAGQSATDSGSVIEVYGSLTLTDGSEDKTGTITGGNVNNFSGGVYVNAGTFTMQGGTITGNQGGAGGVYVAGDVDGDPFKSGKFNMTGGTITGNNATGFGGGVCVSEGCTFNVSGSPVISGNWTEGSEGREADDVHLSATNTSRTYITVTGALTSGASIYVNGNAEAGRAFARADNYTIRETDAACFHSDVGDSLAAMLEDNEVMFKKSLTEGMIGAIAEQTYTGSAITPAVTVEDNSNALTLGEDYTVSYSNNVNAAESTAASAPTVTVTGKGGYTGTASKTFTINKKPVTVSGITAEDRVYDGTTAATLVTTAATFGGICEGDTLAVTATGAFANANAGENKTVNISNITLGGASAANYVLATDGQQESATASITGIQVYIDGVAASDKTYDGTDAATVTGTAALKKASNNEAVTGLTVSDITAKFADKNVGTGKTVTITGGTLSDTTNYTLVTSATTGLTANITAKPVTITGLSAENKVYNGKATATVTGTAVISGLVSGDTVTVTAGSAAFADKNAGDGKTVTFTGYALDGADKGNYALSAQPASTTANITKANATCTKAPTAIDDLAYTGEAQALVKAGSAAGGVMQYSLDGNTYGTGIPEGTDAKSYTVYYKVVGDENHNNVAPASIAVSIAKADQTAPALTSPVTITAPATTAEITGVTTAMEYSTDNKTWTACDAPFSVGKGVYYIRLKEKDNYNASPAATVIVKGADEHALTVTGGTGSGGYKAGASVSVSATVPAGERFKNWTATPNNALTDEQKASASVTFTMPDDDVTLSADFEDKPLESVSLPATLSLRVGATQALTPTFTPSDCKYKAVTWESGNTSVVTVDENGKLTAVAVGGPVNHGHLHGGQQQDRGLRRDGHERVLGRRLVVEQQRRFPVHAVHDDHDEQRGRQHHQDHDEHGRQQDRCDDNGGRMLRHVQD